MQAVSIPVHAWADATQVLTHIVVAITIFQLSTLLAGEPHHLVLLGRKYSEVAILDVTVPG